MSDLSVEAVVVGYSKSEPLIIGKNKTLTLNISVENLGEPAYLSELLILLPSETPSINQASCSLLTDQQKQEFNASLQCDLGNPLQKNNKVSVQIKIDVSKLNSNTDSISIFLRTKTASDKIKPSDNDLEERIYFKAVADPAITGIAKHEQIVYEDREEKAEDREEKAVSITHTYFIKNYGPSHIQKLNIQLFIPKFRSSENGEVDFIGFANIDIEVDNGNPSPKCNDSSIHLEPLQQDTKKSNDGHFDGLDDVQNANNRSLRRVPTEIISPTEPSQIYKNMQNKNAFRDGVSSQKKQDFVLDCSTAKCLVLNCEASPLDSQKGARISLSLLMKTAVLNENLGRWYTIEYTTMGRISISDENGKIHQENHYPDESRVKTILIHKGPPPSEEIKKWIIFVSVGGGILLFLIILAVLIRIGFFKRQQKEKMQEMKMQADLKEWEPYLIANEVDGSDGEVLNNS